MQTPTHKIYLLFVLFFINTISLSAQTPIKLTAENITIPQGEIECLDIIADDFTDINKMNFSMLWNATNFVLDEVTNFGIPGMDATNFAFNPNFGSLAVEWTNATGQTVPNGTVIFSVCLEAIGNIGQMSTITFGTIPTNICVTNPSSGQSIGLDADNGSMTIVANVDPLLISDARIVDVTCLDENGGAIDIIVEGGVSPYTYSWSNGEMTEDITGLSQGMYTVNITDSNVPATTITMTYTVGGDITPPAAVAMANGMIACATPTIRLDGTGSETGLEISYLWTTMDGNILSGEDTLSPEIDLAGTYNLLVTNDLTSCIATAMVTVTGNADLPVANAGMDVMLSCGMSTINLNGNGSDSGPTIVVVWETIDGNIVSGANTTTPTVDTWGTYDLTVVNTATACSAMATVRVLPPELPLADAGIDTVLTCAEPQVMLDGSASTTGTDISYLWTTVNGNIAADETMLNPTVDAAGIYDLLVTNTANNCTASASVMVGGDGNQPTADAGETMELDCSGNPLFLDGSGSSMGADFSYSWTTNGGSIVDGATTLSPEVNGVGTYILIVSNTASDCTAQATVEVTATIDLPTAGVVPNVEIGCAGSTATLDGNSSSMGANFDYLWTTTNGNFVSGTTTLSPVVDQIGTYQLTVTNTDNGCSAVANVEVALGGNLAAANAGDDLVTCFDTATVIGNLPSGTTGVWTSDFVADVINPTDNEAQVNNLIVGVNQLVWTLSSGDCMDYSSDTTFVILEGRPDAYDDQQLLAPGANTINIDVTANDDFLGVGSWEIYFLNEPSAGTYEDLGDGEISYTMQPDFIGTTQITYELCNFACAELCDTATLFIIIEDDTVEPPAIDSLALPNGITPNGDGLNDTFVFDVLLDNPTQYPDSELLVFNRWGDVVYQSRPYNNDWEGENQSGQPLPEGTYYYIMRLDVANSEIIRGDITIIK